MATPSTVQFGRSWMLTLQLGDRTKALPIPVEQRISFEVRASDGETPNTLSARIYNLSKDTVNTIVNSATGVILQAGYGTNAGQIFTGDVKQFRIGAEDAKDSYLDVFAADGDVAYTKGVISKSYPAGTSDADILVDLAKAMNLPPPTEATLGQITLGGILPRGKTLFGMTRGYAREIADRNNCRWSIQNGALTMIPVNGYLPGEAVDISPATGLIGIPEQTENGITVRCYLNSHIEIGRTVRIKKDDIAHSTRWGIVQFPTYKGAYFGATISGSGLYRVMVAEHSGDTRGNDWFTELTCLAVDESANPQNSVQGS